MSENPEFVTELSVEDLVNGFAEIERHPLNLENTFVSMSIDTLQQYRPDLTDEVLAEAGIIRGRDFITLYNGTVMRGVMV